MNKVRALLAITVVILGMSGCENNITAEDNSDIDTRGSESTTSGEGVIENIDIENVTEDEEEQYQLKVRFTDVNKYSAVEIIEEGDYVNSIIIYDEYEQVIYESSVGELHGRVREISIVDFDGDQLEDILVVTDLGGSGGVHEYQLYTYDGSNVVLSNFESVDLADRFKVDIEDDAAMVTFEESGEFERVEFSEETKSMLDSLDVSSVTDYFWGSQIISYYFDNNSDLILVSRSQLMIEHKLLVIAEVEVEYVKRDSEWDAIRWDVIVK